MAVVISKLITHPPVGHKLWPPAPAVTPAKSLSTVPFFNSVIVEHSAVLLFASCNGVPLVVELSVVPVKPMRYKVGSTLLFAFPPVSLPQTYRKPVLGVVK